MCQGRFLPLLAPRPSCWPASLSSCPSLLAPVPAGTWAETKSHLWQSVHGPLGLVPRIMDLEIPQFWGSWQSLNPSRPVAEEGGQLLSARPSGSPQTTVACPSAYPQPAQRDSEN